MNIPPSLFLFDVSHTVENATGLIALNDYRVTVARAITCSRMELHEMDAELCDRADAIALKMAHKSVADAKQLRASCREIL